MAVHRNIIIGCKDSRMIPLLIRAINTGQRYNYTIIHKKSKLFEALTYVNPYLVLLAFDKNQKLIDELMDTDKSKRVPIVCISNMLEWESLSWNNDRMVFSVLYSDSISWDYLEQRICSFLRLLEQLSDQTKHKEHNGSLNSDSQLYSKKLRHYMLELEHKSGMLSSIQQQLIDIQKMGDVTTNRALNSVINLIKINKNESQYWKEFQFYFDHTEPDFLCKLTNIYPHLTHKDVKYCCCIKMNLSNHEIQRLMRVNLESVRTHKYRLKKKLLLSKEQDLAQYLMSNQFLKIN